MEKNHKIFPSEILNHTSNFYFRRYNSQSIKIYQWVICLLILILFAIFFIKVDISVQGVGMLKSRENKNQLRSLVTGRIDSVFVSENSKVNEGDKIFTVKSEVLNEKTDNTYKLLSEYTQRENDLKKLILMTSSRNWEKTPRLNNPEYQQEANFFYQRIKEAEVRFKLVEKDYTRNQILFESGAISEANFEKVTMSYENAKSQLKTIYPQQAAIWQSQLNQLRLASQDIRSQNKQLEEEKEFYTFHAPVGGNVQNIRQLFSGASVSSGELLGEITPDGDLIAEIYVKPQDIGFIHPGTNVKFQVDAFNYNEWGFLQGEIQSISQDVFVENDGQPFFKIRCSIDKEYMELKNGYKGGLMKGMTIQARFIFTKRRIASLLFDSVDDWINPNLVSKRYSL